MCINNVETVGVTERYRRCGVGRYLMTSVLSHVTSNLSECWAVYLHVVSSNSSAIGQSHTCSLIHVHVHV